VLQVITPSRSLVLCADSRREMEEWIGVLKMAASKEYYEVSSGSVAHYRHTYLPSLFPFSLLMLLTVNSRPITKYNF
jgi:hypothetical protein